MRTRKLLDACGLLLLGFQRLFPRLIALWRGEAFGGRSEGHAEELVDCGACRWDCSCSANDHAAVNRSCRFCRRSIGERSYTKQKL